MEMEVNEGSISHQMSDRKKRLKNYYLRSAGTNTTAEVFQAKKYNYTAEKLSWAESQIFAE